MHKPRWYLRRLFRGLLALTSILLFFFVLYWEETGFPTWLTILLLLIGSAALVHARADAWRWLDKFLFGNRSANRRGFLPITDRPPQ